MSKGKYFIFVGICFGFLFSFSYFNAEKTQIVVHNLDKLTVATEAGFKDENFYACVVGAAGMDEGTVMTDEELAAITDTVGCAERNITDVTGIEKLTGVTKINLDKNNISEIDLSKNDNLEWVVLSNNSLNNLDVSKNINLKSLYVSNNGLTSIDLSNNLLLENVDLSSNQISSIDLSNLTALKSLFLSDNQVSSLVVKDNSLLESLTVASNKLSEIDLSNNEALINLNLSDNQLRKVDLANNLLLKELNISSNLLNDLEITKHALLTTLDIAFNNFDFVNLESQKSLERLTLDYTIASKMDFSDYSLLDTLTLAEKKIIPVYSNVNENNVRTFSLKSIENYFSENIVVNDYEIYSSFNPNNNSNLITDSVITTTDNNYYFGVIGNVLSNTGISFKGTQKFKAYYELRFITLTSDKYVINDDNSIDVGGDSDDEIKKHLQLSWDEAKYEINGDKLLLKYNNTLLKEFSIQRVVNPATGSLLVYFIVVVAIISGISAMMIRRNMILNNEI